MLLLAACQQAPLVQHFSGKAQGASYNVSFWLEQHTDRAALQRAIEEELVRIDLLMSNYRDDSVIEQFNALNAHAVMEVGTEIVELVQIAKQISAATNGCYDLTIASLFRLWGFRDAALTVPESAVLAAKRTDLGMQQISIINQTTLQKQTDAVRLDLSSIAQGYSVQRLVEIARANGIKNYLIEIGGELETAGHKPDGSNWRIGIERPLPGNQRLHKLVQINQNEPLAIMTSGTYRHYYDQNGIRYSHILDARTGAPVTHNTVSVTLFHDDLTEADAWSTALLCLGATEGLKVAEQYNLAAFFIEQDEAVLQHDLKTPSQAPAMQLKEYPSLALQQLVKENITFLPLQP
ncbi:FAD:protein FMN transferase [Alishewanella longhuensis]|uniref:FAD:protein FMN transferase n=1 Tax=Alishewanella longhuensis TaxID=1091037 RepID=A0ABQ3L3J6_9ALTE|nr:FAD:protein FMN transferase [Alishewanella longhuensis]